MWTSLLLAAALRGDPPADPAVQRGPEVSDSRHDSSPPLRDLPPAPRRTEKRVHPVKPLPRPKPPVDKAGVPAVDKDPK